MSRRRMGGGLLKTLCHLPSLKWVPDLRSNKQLLISYLQPVDFTQLKPTTNSFLRQLLIQTFVSTQVSTPVITNTLPSSRNRGAIEEVFIKATRIEALASGLIYFLSGGMGHDEPEETFVKWAIGVALGTLRVGMDVIPNL